MFSRERENYKMKKIDREKELKKKTEQNKSKPHIKPNSI